MSNRWIDWQESQSKMGRNKSKRHLDTITTTPNRKFRQHTGNLITNGTFDDGTTGWTLSGDAVRIGDCCPGGHDLEFGASGSIEQTFDLITPQTTQAMLNNGITLNSTVEIQNGECGVQGVGEAVVQLIKQ